MAFGAEEVTSSSTAGLSRGLRKAISLTDRLSSALRSALRFLPEPSSLWRTKWTKSLAVFLDWMRDESCFDGPENDRREQRFRVALASSSGAAPIIHG
jgi:hypothetical protein